MNGMELAKKKKKIGNEIREVARDQVILAVVRLLGLFYLFSIEYS